jgi:Ca2+-binding EF-hand superfamily protein
MTTTKTNRIHVAALGLLAFGAIAMLTVSSADAAPRNAPPAGKAYKMNKSGKARAGDKAHKRTWAGKDHKNGKRAGKRGRSGQMFAKLDTNNDGSLSRFELRSAPEKMQQKLAGADINRDGLITRAELRASFKKHRAARTGGKGKARTRGNRGNRGNRVTTPKTRDHRSAPTRVVPAPYTRDHRK